MAKWELYTENKNKEMIEIIVGTYFDGFSIIEQTGFWKGTKEESLLISIVGNIADQKDIKSICEKIKRMNKQETVMVLFFACSQDFF